MAGRRSMTRDLISEIEEVRNCDGHWSWLLAELVGPKRLWLRACGQAVAQGRGDWLARFLPGHADPHWFLDLMAYCNAEYEGVATAIAACAQVALLLTKFPSLEADPIRATAIAKSLHEAAVEWQWTHLLDPGDVAELGARAECAICNALHRADPHHQQAEAMVKALKQLHQDWQLAPVRDLLLFFLGRRVDVWDKTVRVPIPADLGLDHGSVVTLVLQSRAAGLGEFYGDPRSMAFLHADPEFQEAHELAWAYARRWHDGCTDVRWTLSHPSHHFLEAKGASVGAGFALGLMHLLDPSRPSLNRQWAITGDITAEGQLQAVNGYPAKLQGLCFEGYKVIVPAADLGRLRTSPACRLPELEGASTVEQAS
jgi:hypothetical protein